MTAQRFAILDGEEVVNLILWDSEEEYPIPEGHTAEVADNDVDLGWKLIDGRLMPPEVVVVEDPLVPTEDPTLRDAKLEALRQLMELGITEPVARTIVGLPPA